jgi:hypothetical protein
LIGDYGLERNFLVHKMCITCDSFPHLSGVVLIIRLAAWYMVTYLSILWLQTWRAKKIVDQCWDGLMISVIIYTILICASLIFANWISILSLGI